MTRDPRPPLPRLAAALFRALIPDAEREEVIADLQSEFALRARVDGRGAARRWVWRQALRSLPALLGRGWWRGMTGFEPHSSRMRPGGPMFESWIMDVRYAARRLMKRRTYAALAVLTLALGAGGTAAIYSVVRALLLEPLPIAREDQVGVLWFHYSWTEEEFMGLRGAFPGFSGMAAFRPSDQTLDVPGAPLRLLPGIATSHELFDVLGAPPALGRTFRPGEDLVGAEPVAVISHGLWQELGADPAIIGTPLRLGGGMRTVVGVMPRGFWFPSPLTRVWTPAPMSPQRRSGLYTLVGRVAPGVSVHDMRSHLDALTATMGTRFAYPMPQWDKTKTPSVMSAREFLVGDLRPGLLATLVAMALILLIACANVAALMLGQVDARATELALRSALGANRGRMVQQLVIEALLIGALAGAAGAVLASSGFGVLVDALPLGALAENTRLDWTVFWTSFAAALLAALLVAVVPGIALWRGGTLRAALATTRTGGIAGRSRLEGGLVIAQIAVAVLLAAGAGLLIRSVANLRAIDPGFQAEGAVIADVTMPLELTHRERRRVILDALAGLERLPGVHVVAATQKVPLRGSGDNWGIEIVGKPDAGGTTGFRIVTRNYFEAMGMSIRRGRNFDASDREGSDPVVIINEALAAKYFGDADPIGHTIDTGFETGERIVGVVSNAAEADLTDGPEPARYMLYEHLPITPPEASLVVRAASAGLAPALIPPVRAAIEREGTRLAVQEITTLGRLFDLAVGPAGRIVTLLSLLAGLALVLGAIGVYGVISHYVSRRSREYGICIALGERPAHVVRQVVGRGARLVAIGSAIGIGAALALTRLLTRLLYGVESGDPLTMGAAVVVLLLVGMLAAFIPARRASRTDPAIVLRDS